MPPAVVAATDPQSVVDAARRGDRKAFASLVETHQTMLFAYLRARLTEPADAEDLCQEAFLRCYIARDKLTTADLVAPWLIGIARNVLREHVRKVSRRREVVWTELCLQLEELSSTEDGFQQEAISLLPHCIESLGESARTALDMKYRSQLKLQEIGEKLSRSEGAVKLLMFRARQALKNCLDRRLNSA